MQGYARYAVYWAPRPDSALARLGAAWLGWDPERRVASPPPRPDRVADPRRYGLHATLKAPFRLEGAPGDLAAAVQALAARTPPVLAPGLVPSDAMGFAALVPGGPCPDLDTLAGTCVRDLDRFRAPLTDQDRARRGALDPGLAANLDAWGYPYVFEAFRFHVTLTGPGPMPAELPDLLAGCLDPSFRLEDLCLFGDPGGGAAFHLVARYPLAG